MNKNKEYFYFVLMLGGLGAIFHYTFFIVMWYHLNTSRNEKLKYIIKYLFMVI